MNPHRPDFPTPGIALAPSPQGRPQTKVEQIFYDLHGSENANHLNIRRPPMTRSWFHIPFQIITEHMFVRHVTYILSRLHKIQADFE